MMHSPTCPLMYVSLEVPLAIAINDVDDDIARMDIIIRRKTMVQMTLSPSRLSSMFQNPVLLFF